MCVTVCRHHLEHTIVDRQDRHIEGAATKVKHQDVFLAALLVKAIRNRGSGWLIDDAGDVEASNDACILGCLALRVVEVCGDSHHSMLYLLAQEALSCLFHLAQNHGRDLLRAEDLGLTLDLDLHVGLARLVYNLVRNKLLVTLHVLVSEAATNQPLHVVDCVVRVDGCLVLGSIANETLLRGERHIRWGNAIALIVGDNLDAAVLVDAHARVRGAEINADYSAELFFIGGGNNAEHGDKRHAQQQPSRVADLCERRARRVVLCDRLEQLEHRAERRPMAHEAHKQVLAGWHQRPGRQCGGALAVPRQRNEHLEQRPCHARVARVRGARGQQQRRHALLLDQMVLHGATARRAPRQHPAHGRQHAGVHTHVRAHKQREELGAALQPDDGGCLRHSCQHLVQELEAGQHHVF
mmetsp:Transcript_41505/g.124027  ORF Transcript_41505/g.124027 Transcript_41505/m.124027 type:complete len:411 (+) Transcript_41505:1501-2733(+)